MVDVLVTSKTQGMNECLLKAVFHFYFPGSEARNDFMIHLVKSK